jgi:trehalose/maltose hydrolase-like predicted phosphorylase
MASLGGAWTALVAGFGGLRHSDGMLSLDPMLPDGLAGLTFSLRWRGARLRVEVRPTEVTYAVHGSDHAGLWLLHAGEQFEVTPDAPVTRPVRRRKPLLPRPKQPAGREPMSAIGDAGAHRGK